MSGSTGGRAKRWLTDDEVRHVEKLAALLSVSQLADFLGIGERTFFRRLKDQPEVLAAYKKGRAGAIAGVARTLLQAALDGDRTAQIFYLKAMAGWKDRGGDQYEALSPRGADELDELSEEQLRERARRLVNERLPRG